MVRDRGPADQTPAGPSALDRAKTITRSFGEDPDLNSWAARMIASADDFQKRRRPDPLGGFLVTHKR